MNPNQTIQKFLVEGQLAEARASIEQVEATMFADPDYFALKAAAALMEDDLEEAKRVLLRGLKIDPKHADLLYHLAYVYRAKGEDVEAFPLYEKALENARSEDLQRLIQHDLQALLTQVPDVELSYHNRPLVSIIVLAYNNLDYTMACVESILTYTKTVNYELILVNNGSSDGTREFFDSLPQARKVHLEENVGPVNGFNEGIKVARGKYTACVCNDFIFTPRWMDNLLACIESEDSIGFVSPGASSVSNLQGIAGTYSNVEEMLAFAESYNHSNPRKWEDRVRLLPCVLMIRTFLLKEIGGYDPRFYFGEFADDDISFRVRRSGYRLVYCKDTFTYHFGSVTTRENQIHKNSLGVSRNIFLEKFGLDSWEEASFINEMAKTLAKLFADQEARILGINAKCGGNPLQVKNYLKEKGVDPITITNYCTDDKYQEDLRTVSDRVESGSLSNLLERLAGQRYNMVILEHHGNVFDRQPKLLDRVSSLLDEGGLLAVSITTDQADERLMTNMSALLQKNGYQVQHQKYVQNGSNGVELITIGKRGLSQ